jgi:hypothetical protein
MEHPSRSLVARVLELTAHFRVRFRRCFNASSSLNVGLVARYRFCLNLVAALFCPRVAFRYAEALSLMRLELSLYHLRQAIR